MTESFITQCPHCGTSFRVRNEQLSVANGSVRCGACLQVFSARNHVVTMSIPAQQPIAPKKPAQKPPVQKQSRAAKPAQPRPPTRQPLVPPPKESDFDSFMADDEDDTEFLFEADQDDDSLFDESPDDLFEQEESGFGELSDSFLNLGDSPQDQNNKNAFQRETQSIEKELFEETEDDDESWAESILEEIEKEDGISLSKPAVFESKDVSQRNKNKKPHTGKQHKSSMLMDFEKFEEPAKNSHSHVIRQSTDDLIDIDFNAEERVQLLRPLGWVAIVLLTVLLAGQFAWFERDTFARMDQWRGIYSKTCSILKCTLPEQIDLDQIRTSVLVREHKNTNLKDIRIVDIVLTNKAPFKQVFPVMLLQYTDVNGKLVADQSFLPEHYLKGEMTGIKTMPINTRIYVSLPIKTPAKNAVNYQLILNTSKG